MSFLDFRAAFRSLRKARLFTAVAIVSLALGIGANTAIFSLVDQLLLRLLPVKDPHSLVQLAARGAHYGNNWGYNTMSFPMYRDFRERNEVFSSVFARRDAWLSMGYAGRTERVKGELVTGNYFMSLGVGVAAGRAFTDADDQHLGAHPVAMLSHGYWQSRFAGDRAIAGRTILLNGLPMTVVGVAQAGFQGVEVGDATQVFVSLSMQKQMIPVMAQIYTFEDRRSRWMNVFARLKPGIAAGRAQTGIAPLYRQILEMEVKEKAFRNSSAYDREQFLKSRMEVMEGAMGRSSIRQQYGRPLKVLLAMTGLVLLIACANVANLMLARAASRQKEIALRLSLGAGRARIVGQLLFECFVISAAAATVGIGIGKAIVRYLLAFFGSDDGSMSINAALDPRVLAFSLALAVATTFLFGLVPALQSSKPKLASTLKDEAGSVAGGGAQSRLRKGLVAAQVGLSLVLLIGCGLFVRSLMNLKNVDPGFRADRLMKFAIDPSLQGYSKARMFDLYDRLLETMKARPGHRSAGYALMELLGGDGEEWDSTVTVEGYQAKPGEDMGPHFNSVGPGYFATVGIPLLAGRDFNRNDQPKSAKVCLVNQSFAKKYFGSGLAVGRRVGQGGDPGTKLDIEIVGVVADAKYEAVRKDAPRQVFLPFGQMDFLSGMNFYVRTDAAPETFFSSVRALVRTLDPNVPVFATRTMEEQASRTLSTERMIASLSATFGALATLLAVVGLYGVMAFTVTRRSREFGIRLALGAESSRILAMVMREAGWLVFAGIAVALPVSWWLSRFVRSQLFGIEPADPWLFAGAAALLAAVAAVAGFVPAWRASRVNPVSVLRYE